MPAVYTMSAEAAGTGPGFRGVVGVSFGNPAAPSGDSAGIRSRRDLHFESADAWALRHLKSVLVQACVGVRLVLSGPPADVQAAAAAAAECGLVDEEITLLTEGAGPLVVFCGHCHTPTPSAAGPGSEIECRGCARVLAVSSHFSRRKAAFLGFAAHAEEAS